ncbi:MAG: hypothetical protein Q7S65_02490 [Nanoarchaeota archaeon]|nr:hypothetical protein [Nanoarchaeota archaeon]
MRADHHLNVAAELLKMFTLAEEPKLLLACVEQVREALRGAGIISPLARTLDTIIRKHRESPMVFSRREKLVICDDRYAMETLDGNRVSRFLEQARTEIGGAHERELFAGR